MVFIGRKFLEYKTKSEDSAAIDSYRLKRTKYSSIERSEGMSIQRYSLAEDQILFYATAAVTSSLTIGGLIIPFNNQCGAIQQPFDHFDENTETNCSISLAVFNLVNDPEYAKFCDALREEDCIVELNNEALTLDWHALFSHSIWKNLKCKRGGRIKSMTFPSRTDRYKVLSWQPLINYDPRSLLPSDRSELRFGLTKQYQLVLVTGDADPEVMLSMYSQTREIRQFYRNNSLEGDMSNICSFIFSDEKVEGHPLYLFMHFKGEKRGRNPEKDSIGRNPFSRIVILGSKRDFMQTLEASSLRRDSNYNRFLDALNEGCNVDLTGEILTVRMPSSSSSQPKRSFTFPENKKFKILSWQPLKNYRPPLNPPHIQFCLTKQYQLVPVTYDPQLDSRQSNLRFGLTKQYQLVPVTVDADPEIVSVLGKIRSDEILQFVHDNCSKGDTSNIDSFIFCSDEIRDASHGQPKFLFLHFKGDEKGRKPYSKILTLPLKTVTNAATQTEKS